MKRFFLAVLRVLKNNLFLKVMALLFAFILWSYAMADPETVRTITIEDVPVSYVGTEELAAKNLTVNSNLSEMVEEIDITVKVLQRNVQSLKAENINATVDLSKINEAGTYDLTVNVSFPVTVNRVNSISPNTVTVVSDDLVEREIPVRYELQGEPMEGYYVGTPQLSQESVTLKGPREEVEQVTEAVCYIPISNLESSVRASYMLTLYNAEGERVSTNRFEGTLPTVIVDLEVLHTKIVPVDTSQIKDSILNVKQGYEVTNVEIEPSEVEIAAPDELLSKVEEVTVQPISAEGADRVVLLDGYLQAPEGVIFVDGNHVDALVQIDEIQTEKIFENVKIRIDNVEEGYRASLSVGRVDVTIKGGVSAVEAIKTADVQVYVDCANLTAGSHVRSVKAESIAGIDSGDITFSSPSITVNIMRK